MEMQAIRAVLEDPALKNGPARIDSLGKHARVGLVAALAGGHVVVRPGHRGVDVVQRVGDQGRGVREGFFQQLRNLLF